MLNPLKVGKQCAAIRKREGDVCVVQSNDRDYGPVEAPAADGVPISTDQRTSDAPTPQRRRIPLRGSRKERQLQQPSQPTLSPISRSRPYYQGSTRDWEDRLHSENPH